MGVDSVGMGSSSRNSSSPSKRIGAPSVMLTESVEIARDSGARANMGTFGKADRFNLKLRVGPGMHSPNGEQFYIRNPLWKMPSEVGKQCTQGIGPRSDMKLMGGGPKVGPGSYEIVASAAKSSSPLDGVDYCKTTIKKKLPSKMVNENNCSPGPHAKYEVRKPLDHHLPQYHKERMSHGSRHPKIEDRDGPGPGTYEPLNYTVAASASCPALTGQSSAGGSKRHLKSTFGMSDRFTTAKQTCSPWGEMYYVHSKFKTSEDYLAEARSCGFGGANKVDFANPYKLSSSQRNGVSPVTYQPVASTAKPTSPLDGFTIRSPSPIFAACKALAAVPKKTRSMKLNSMRRLPNSMLSLSGEGDAGAGAAGGLEASAGGGGGGGGELGHQIGD